MDCYNVYSSWLENVSDPENANLLRHMEKTQIEDCFYCDLVFGTGGLRGVIGAGTNRMNIYTVSRASQGVANYLLSKYNAPSVVIGYDSRIKSDSFAKTAASVFAANGIEVNIWPELMPVPSVSYAIRRLNASAGIMITASHNPRSYNGYKVYGVDGCQITTKTAAQIQSEINKLDIFKDIISIDFDDAFGKGLIHYIGEDILNEFVKEEKLQSVLFGDYIDRDISIVYSPLNGTGLKLVTRTLSETGFHNISIVEEQRLPDGDFPTCPYPNPEIKEAMELGIQLCKKIGADLLLATDPDCDRCGIAVRDGNDFRLLSGNEIGILLLEFICSQRKKHDKMPEHPVFIKTIVTTNLAERIAADFGVETINVLTGFKYIGETIGKLDSQEKEQGYIFGFEESFGYLSGAFVRDKDAVNAAFLISEMFAYYKTRGLSLLQKLSEIYERYGYSMTKQHSFEFEGSDGELKMTRIMSKLRKGVDQLSNHKVIEVIDYLFGINGLPQSDVIEFVLEKGSIVVRPSGTEPKLKVYNSITANNEKEAGIIENQITEDLICRFIKC